MTTFRVEKRIKHHKDSGYPVHEIVITAITVFNPRTWKTIVEREYNIHVWQIGAKLFAWRVTTAYQDDNGQTLYSTLLSGSNGGNGELYRGIARTFHEATKSFRILATK